MDVSARPGDELCFMPATELAGRIRARDVSPVEAVQAFFERIEACDVGLNAYTTLLHDEAQTKARDAERRSKSGHELGPLHGVPVAIKDLEPKAGVRNTWGSKALADYVASEDSVHVQRLEEAGAIVLGTTNVPEFGHKGCTDNYLFGPTSSPFARGHNAGGSSGGSAAAVGAALCALAQGSDGGGSIRIPASLSGVYGIKPSRGRVPFAPRPDAFGPQKPFVQVGPLTRTVEDAALMLTVIAGPHERDPTCIPGEVDWLSAARGSIAGLRVAYSPDLGVFPVDGRVSSVVGDAVHAFEAAGADVDTPAFTLGRPHSELIGAWIRWSSVFYAAMISTFEEQEGIDLVASRDDVTPSFLTYVDLAPSVTGVAYRLDDIIRTEVFDAFQDLFEDYDLLVTPTVAAPPPANSATRGHTLGPTEIGGEAIEPMIGWCMTYPMNFSGHPAASVPAGFTEDGLPIGLQIVGRQFRDDMVLAASAAFERARPWHDAYATRLDLTFAGAAGQASR